MNKAVPAPNNEVLASLIVLAKDAERYAGAGILRMAYQASIMRRAAQARLGYQIGYRRQLPRK